MTRVIPPTLFKTDDAIVIVPPAVKPYKARFVIERTTRDGAEWFNAWQKRWYLTKQIFGPSAQNPKASYFRTAEKADEVLATLTPKP
jgi:hypothetical protein